jgi:uncharacterized protein YkwD
MKLFRCIVTLLFLTNLQNVLSGSFNQAGQSAHETPVDTELVLKYVNSNRAKGFDHEIFGLPPAKELIWNDTLALAALHHCNDMNKNDFFSHTGSDGFSIENRLKNLDYRWSACGENIARGYGDEKSVIVGWIRSPGHRKNIMNQSFRKIGVARVGDYWTMVLSN